MIHKSAPIFNFRTIANMHGPKADLLSNNANDSPEMTIGFGLPNLLMIRDSESINMSTNCVEFGY